MEAEDYDAAKRLKAAEQELRSLGGQLAQLEVSKRCAVRDEDYDRAKLLKNEIVALRRRVDDALRQYDIRTCANGHLEDQCISPLPAPVRVARQQFISDAVLSATENMSGPTSSCTQPSIPKHKQQLQLELVPPRSPQVILPPMTLESPTLPSQDLSQDNDIEPDQVGNRPGNVLVRSPEPPPKIPQFFYPGDNGTSGIFPLETETILETSICGDALTVNAEQTNPVELALEGVPNAMELPAPEPCAADISGDADLASICSLFGSYRARCLFSKNWALREAALAKARLLIDANHWERTEDLELLCDVARIGVQDKIAQVYLTALALLDDIAHKLAARGLKRADAFSALEPALVAVVAKLGDNQPRLREKAVDALTSLSHCRVIGADRVAEKVMRSLEKRRPPHNKWRPIATRLEFLRRLALDFGIENRDASKKGSHTLALESVIAFVEVHGCASHTFEEVRMAAKDLMVVVFVAASNADRARLFDPFLAKLRPMQAEEYLSAVNRRINKQGDNTNDPISSQLELIAGPVSAPLQVLEKVAPEARPQILDKESNFSTLPIRTFSNSDGDDEYTPTMCRK